MCAVATQGVLVHGSVCYNANEILVTEKPDWTCFRHSSTPSLTNLFMKLSSDRDSTGVCSLVLDDLPTLFFSLPSFDIFVNFSVTVFLSNMVDFLNLLQGSLICI